MLAVTGISRHGFLLPKFSAAQASLNVNLTIQSLPLHLIPPYCGLIQQKDAEKSIDRVSLFFSHKKPPTAKSAVGGNIISN